VIWALINLIVGYALFRTAGVSNANYLTLIIFFAGIAAISLILSFRFAEKMRE